MTQFAWVIESKGPHTPLYWDGGDWSQNHMRAVRFARQVDAERVMINLPSEFRWPDMKATEHGWMDVEPMSEAASPAG